MAIISTTREQRRQLIRENARHPEFLTPVPKSVWPDVQWKNKPFAVWRSRDYLVQAYSEQDQITRLSIAKTTMQANGRWVEGLSWDELQEIKRQVGLGDQWAVEVYPADAKIVDVASMRHLWIVPVDLVPFAWGAKT